ncbi:MAG: DUF4382 domain-containing protein [Campylobacterota bacterium]|nr:DUF4382 domain-containing protein [Campylobacterota bacterium]
MKRIHKIAGIVLSFAIITLIAGCGGSSSSSGTTSGYTPSTPSTKTETGVMSLSITDAKPRLPDEPIAVNIRVTGIEFNYNGKWTDVNEFEFENDEFENDKFEPQTFNLLELQDGHSLHLGNFILPVGHYKEIRFKLDAAERNGKVKSNPGCNIVFEDDNGEEWSVPLFVPSGGQSGYKGKGKFEITANAQIEITADFNVEKSIVVAGKSGKYLLKPVIRLVVTELSGTIKGTVVDMENYPEKENDLSVYAYEHGTYDNTYPEGDEVSGNSDGVFFTNAVSSTDVNMTDGNFTLSFLKAGAYDLVTVNYPAGTENTNPVVVDMEKGADENGVIVSKATETSIDVNTTD